MKTPPLLSVQRQSLRSSNSASALARLASRIPAMSDASRAKRVPNGVIQGHAAVKSYEQARRECQTSVERIVKECRRVNQKYTDPHFDIELDLKSNRRHYLDELDKVNDIMKPRGVKRVKLALINCRSTCHLSICTRASLTTYISRPANYYITNLPPFFLKKKKDNHVTFK